MTSTTGLLRALPIAAAAVLGAGGASFAAAGELPSTVVVFASRTGGIVRINPERAAQRFTPCSTFKIPNALISLQQGVITPESSRIRWDPVRDPRQDSWPESWAHDQDLESAIRNSVVWYFRELARRVGAARMASAVRRLRYGNMDTSAGGGVDRFWLSGTLTISADEQVDFLRRFHAGKLGFDPRHTAAVEHALVLERGGDWVLSGKTGGCRAAGGKYIGWLVGYVEKGKDLAVYAGNVEGSSYDEVAAARTRVVRAELEKLGYLPRPPQSPQAPQPPQLPQPAQPAAGRCAAALAAGTVCEAANREAERLLAERRLAGAIVVQDVRSGALAAFASTSAPDARGGAPSPATVPLPSAAPSPAAALDVGSPILPLSIVKLLLAASWWDREAGAAADRHGAGRHEHPIDVHEMLVRGSDADGKRLALALRRSAGSSGVLADLDRYGFPGREARPGAAGRRFWGEIEAPLAARLGPAPAFVAIPLQIPDDEWASSFSLGESGFSVTLLHLSRFLQAVGNGGEMIAPLARTRERAAPRTAAAGSGTSRGQRIMRAETARRLQLAMLDAVQRGSAAGIRERLGGPWKIGGKTGTGPAEAHPYDGCFAGLVFDPQGMPRYTVATYIKAGGRGGGAAAQVSADLARFLVGL
jgi:beta-lactamase class D